MHFIQDEDLQVQLKNLELLFSFFNRCLLEDYQKLNAIATKIHLKDKNVHPILLDLEISFVKHKATLDSMEFSEIPIYIKLQKKCAQYFDAHRFIEEPKATRIKMVDLFNLDENETIGVIGGYIDRVKKNLDENHKSIAQSISQTIITLIKKHK